jgi:type I restriction enzyme R subunit
MRPINSMIEFKQIIGRGTRLYDGKDYFTIYDFVKAHHHFSDPEWDGEPEPTDGEEEKPTDGDDSEPVESGEDGDSEDKETRVRPARIKIKLADGKERNIQHMMVTTFWHPAGTPMSAQQFMEMLFGKLPEFFKNEVELRALWSDPDTRAKLLRGLAEKGFGGEQLAEMQKIINAEKSDLFDVLAYVAYALNPLTRQDRANHAKTEITNHFNSKQQAFLDFVLAQYVKVGVQELDREMLSPLLKLRYNNAIADAIKDLGKPEAIGAIFTQFQQYLYTSAGA